MASAAFVLWVVVAGGHMMVDGYVDHKSCQTALQAISRELRVEWAACVPTGQVPRRFRAGEVRT